MGSLMAIEALPRAVRDGGRHQPGLLLRPQQLGGLHRLPQALRHRAPRGGGAVAERRRHGPHRQCRGAEGGGARTSSSPPCSSPTCRCSCARRTRRGCWKGRKWIFPAAGFQHTSLKKEFTPPGMLFGHNTLYFADPQATPLAKEFVRWYNERTRDWPHWEADRAFFAMEVWRRGVGEGGGGEGRRGAWPSQAEIADAIRGVEVVSLGGPGRMRPDGIAEQTFVQGDDRARRALRLPDPRPRQDRPDGRRGRCRRGRARTSGAGSPRRSSTSDARPAAAHGDERAARGRGGGAVPRRGAVPGGGRAATRLRRAAHPQPGLRRLLRHRRLSRRDGGRLRARRRPAAVVRLAGVDRWPARRSRCSGRRSSGCCAWSTTGTRASSSC